MIWWSLTLPVAGGPGELLRGAVLEGPGQAVLQPPLAPRAPAVDRFTSTVHGAYAISLREKAVSTETRMNREPLVAEPEG